MGRRETFAPRLSDGAAFVLGATVVIVMALVQGALPGLLPYVLLYLCPGFILGPPLVGFLTPIFAPDQTPNLGWIFPSAAAVNGVFWVVAWYLVRISMKGVRTALILLLLGLGIWTAWYIQWYLENGPKPERPLMPVDLASPFAGRWEGEIHSGRRRDRGKKTSFIFHPRTDGTFSAFIYDGSMLSGEIEDGRLVGDSLYYELGYPFAGRRDGDTMRIEMMEGWTTTMELRRVSADTTTVAQPSYEMPK